MKTRRWVLAGIVLGLALVTLLRAAPQAAPARVPDKLTVAKLEAARRTYEVVWLNTREGCPPPVEVVYRWSRRWLEAELEFTDRKPDQVTLYQAYWVRMRELTRITHDRFLRRLTTVD